MTQDDPPGFQVFPYPRSRLLVVDAARAGSRKHLIHGLIEVDVTEPRQRLRAHRADTGESLSFTAFVLHCLGRAVEADRMVHAYRDWRGRLVVFDDVDVNTIIEVELEGRRFPMAHTVRAANRRSVRDLHTEIRHTQAGGDRTYSERTRSLMQWYVRTPAFLRDLVYRVVLRSPRRMKQIAGTVSLTAVGMFGDGGGWGIPLPISTLCLTLGGITTKPAVVGDQIIPREMLDITLTFDHDIVDGAPAARFANRLKHLIETADGLESLG